MTDRQEQAMVAAGIYTVISVLFSGLAGMFTPMENNAKRIVACVNACEGLPIEELERFGKHAPYTDYAALQAQRDSLAAQNRELVEALEVILRAEFGSEMVVPAGCESTYWGKARAALAKVRP